ncbi:MAG: family 16 glycoside hydrolase, partial [Gemmataceae bacterium]
VVEEGVSQIEKIAQAGLSEIRAEVQQVVRDLRASAPPEEAEQLAQPGVESALSSYLEQVPNSIRASFRRPADPSGKSVPRNFALQRTEDMLRLLPARPPRFKAGDIIAGTWVLRDLLGVGGFGEVWKADHASLRSQEPVALKFCLDPEASRYLKHEAMLMDRVMTQARGPGIVDLRNAHLENDPPCLAFEFINGGDLCNLMNDWLRVPLEKRVILASQIILKLGRILGPLHRLNPSIVHRDLKPANILVVRKDAVKFDIKIADFGIGGLAAKKSLNEATRGVSRGDLLTQTLRGSHTPLYASPEQARGEAPDPRDDVHAMGVIWFQLLTCDLQRGVGADFDEDLRELNVPEATAAAIKKCVASRKERRFADAQELADHIAMIMQMNASDSIAPPQETVQRGAAQDTVRGVSGPPPILEEETLDDTEPTLPTRTPNAKRKRKRATGLPGILVGAAVAGLLLLALLGAAIFTLRTKHGDVVVELSDPTANVAVQVDGENLILSNLGKPLKMTPGEHGLTVSGPDFETVTQAFTVKRGGREVVKVSLKKRDRTNAGTTSPPAIARETNRLGAKSDWTSLFNGEDLTGWESSDGKRIASVTDGAIIVDGSGGGGWLFTQGKDYSDFILRAEFSVRPGANSGICFRARPDDKMVPEIQIIDEKHPKYRNIGSDMKSGALYGLAMNATPLDISPNPWYEIQVELQGQRLKVQIDDIVTVDTNLDHYKGEAKDRGISGLTRRSGLIGLQAHSGVVKFRNIKIKELGPESSSKIPADASFFQGKAFKVFTENLTWSQAKAECEKRGGILACIRSKEESDFLTGLVNKAALDEAWVGATDEQEEGKWVWLDGTPFIYTNWFTGQPNNKNSEEHYMILWARMEGQWCDQPNVSTQHRPGYVCQWKADDGSSP